MIMKRNLLVLLLALMTSVQMLADVVINETNFPDANFRNYLLTNEDPIGSSPENPIYASKTGIGGYGKDGVLTTAELNEIWSITMKNVENLKGIELFPSLQRLDCSGITTETLDLSNVCRPLQRFRLQGSFENLILPSSNRIYELVVDAPLTSFNLPSSCDVLKYFRLDNSNLTTIDLSPAKYNNYMWAEFAIYNPKKPVTVIPPSGIAQYYTHAGRVSLSIVNSVNTSFDFSNFNEMEELELFLKDNSSLTSLTLPTNKSSLNVLSLHNNPLLTSLNVDDYTALEALSYGGNGFKSVNVTENTTLKYLECNGNELTSLDLSNNTELTHLYCQDNLLTSLDLSNNTNLRALECYNNQLTELDLSNNTKLRTERLDAIDRYYTNCARWVDETNSIGRPNGPTYTLEYTYKFDYPGSLYGEFIIVSCPSINISPQILGKDYVAIDGRGKLGVQCNTNNGELTSYGTYSAVTSSDDGNNYIVVADEANGKTDVHKPNSSINYVYTTGYTGAYDAAKTMEVNIGTSAHGMYVHPETLRGSDNFYSGTLYLEFPAKIPEGVQCYYAKGLDANEDLVGLTEVTGTIPANTAVIVKAPNEYKFFAFNESDETPAAPTDNIIEGTIEGLSVAPGTVLTLGHNVDRSTGEYDNFGFWNYRGNWINPFRAYIPKSSLTAGAKNGFSLVFPEDGTTGIARLTNSDTAEDGTWYTLSGIRLTAKPTAKGIYVNGGKKVVIK